MKKIKRYEKTSGQKVNEDKSFFLTDTKASPYKINRLRQRTGFMDKCFPFTYLGCTLYSGRKKVKYFDIIISKVVKS